MTYIIKKDGAEVNRIVADEAFCLEHYNSGGYSFEEEQPETVPEPAGQGPSAAEDTAAMLIDHEYRLTLLELGLSGEDAQGKEA